MEKYIIIFSLIVSLLLLLILVISIVKNNSKKAKEEYDKLIKEGEKLKRELIFEAKEEVHNLKLEAEKEVQEKKRESKEIEERLLQREKNIDRRDELLQKREELVEEKDQKITEKQLALQEEYFKIDDLKEEQLKELSNISKLTKEEAREKILDRVEKEIDNEIAELIKEKEEEATLNVDKKAKEMLVQAMSKYSASVTNEKTITVVNLPNDDMKGRLIGREGRNIRTLEAITGVDLIIDDTPEVIVLSSFDIYRREIAREVLDILLQDGRIHPARIEEVYDTVSKEMQLKLMEYGNQALFELGINKMSKELIEKLGKLHFRTSFGQNALRHSIEVAHLSGLLAAELGENINLAKRAGLLHDIGKAVDHDMEGSHVELGIELAKKYNEPEVVINAIASHHGEVAATSVISSLVAVADSISASRPGARSDTLENYIKRLEDLENIAKNMDGVEKAYAVQAGREIRVMVKPEKINDSKLPKLARDIKKDIEANLQYPGTIKITVIRETRIQEEAK